MNDSDNCTLKLYQRWHQAITANSLINEFQASDTDPGGQWMKGDAIAFGLRWDREKITYYAENRTQKQTIHGAVEEKRIDDISFTCQFHGYRSLRPGGHHRPIGRQPDIPEDPKQCRFFCQDNTHPLSLLSRDPLLQLSLRHFTWNAYYNAAPIEPEGHFLWIPAVGDTLPHFPQRLTSSLLEDGLHLFRKLDHTMVFFNSLHAGASVNHIHFQAMYHKHKLAVETWPLVERSGYALLDGYPAQAFVFARETHSDRLFSWIERFQKHHIPFNLMMSGERIILIPRNLDHEIVAEFPGNGLAALGLCGHIVTVDRLAYLNATADTIKQAFQKMTLPIAQL